MCAITHSWKKALRHFSKMTSLCFEAELGCNRRAKEIHVYHIMSMPVARPINVLVIHVAAQNFYSLFSVHALELKRNSQ